jgi:hypothetical protein
VAEDPGWVPAIGNFWRVLVVPTLAIRTRRGKAMPVLVGMRSVTVAAPVAWLLFLNILFYLHPQLRPDTTTLVASVVAGDGLLTLVLLARLRARLFADARNPIDLASTYRAVFFLAWALYNSVVMFGLVGFFITGRLWVYAVALPFGTAGLFLATPSRARIDRDQKRLREARSKLVLLDALMLANGAVPQRPKKR